MKKKALLSIMPRFVEEIIAVNKLYVYFGNRKDTYAIKIKKLTLYPGQIDPKARTSNFIGDKRIQCHLAFKEEIVAENIIMYNKYWPYRNAKR